MHNPQRFLLGDLMLWLHVKPGQSVKVGDRIVTLRAKDKLGITVSLDGSEIGFFISRGRCEQFTGFTLHAGNHPKGLRLGFDAPEDIRIRIEK